MPEIPIRAVITAKDEASATFRNLGKSVEDLNKTKIAYARTLAGVGAGMTAVGIGALALAKNFIWTAGRTEELGLAMNAVAKATGTSTAVLAEQEKILKKQGITTQEARSALTRFMQANLDVAQASKVARVAQDLAVISAMDSSQATGVLIDSISSLNTMQLQQFGLTKSANDIFLEYAKSLGIVHERVTKTGQVQRIWSRELTETEKKQAIMNYILEEGGRVTGVYETAMTKFSKSWRSLRRYVEESANALGKAFLPFMAKLVEAITAVFKWFLALPESVQKFIGLAVVLGGILLTVGGTIITLVSGFVLLSSALAGAGVSLGIIIEIVAIILVSLAALGVAAYFLVTRWTEFKNFWIDLWNTVSSFFVGVWNSIAQFFIGVWNWIKGTLYPILEDIFVGLTLPFRIVYAIIYGIFYGLYVFFKWIWSMIGDEVTAAVIAIWNTISGWFNVIKNFFVSIWGSIRDFFVGIWNSISNTGGSLAYGLYNRIIGPLNNIKTFWTNIWNSIADFFSGVWNRIADSIKEPLNRVIGAINKVIKGYNDLPWTPNIPTIPYLQKGGIMPYEGLAYLHKGERVTPASMVAGGGGGVTVNFYGPVSLASDQNIEEVARKLGRQLELARQGVY